jgi:hypothetical protein
MKRSKNFLLFLLCFLSFEGLAQTPIKFRKVIGNNGYDYAYSVTQTMDKGYVIGGATSSFGSGNSDLYAVKTDSMGIPRLQRTFGGINIDRGMSVKQTPDKGYAIFGYTNSFGAGGYDMYLVKIDSLFNLQWEKTYGGDDWDFGNSLELTSDGGYLLCGSTYSFGNGDQDYYLVKTDSNGDTTWTRTYGGANEDIARSAIETNDGGYILTGTSKSLGDNNGDIYTVKTYVNGDTAWTHKFGGSLADHGNDLIETLSGSYIIAGETSSFGSAPSNGIVLRLSLSGAHMNDYAIGTTGLNGFNSITEDRNQRIAMCGNTTGFGSTNGDMWFFILNSDWTFYNSSTYGTIKNDFGFSVDTTADRCWIMCGQTNGYNNGLEDMYLIKTDTNGLSGFTGSESNFIISVEEQSTLNSYEFSLSPNPASNEVNISFADKDGTSELVVTDVLGRELSVTRTDTSAPMILNATEFAEGIYFITLRNDKTLSTQRLIIHH